MDFQIAKWLRDGIRSGTESGTLARERIAFINTEMFCVIVFLANSALRNI